MKIFDAKTKENLNIPKWITVKNNSINAINKGIKINDKDGEAFIGETMYSSRLLSCEGVIITDDYKVIELKQAELLKKLSKKELMIFRNDEDDVFYKGFLDGSVKIGYYYGSNTGKAFSINFNLKCVDVFAYGKEKEITFINEMGKVEVVCGGNYNILPTIEISNVERLSGKIIEVNNSGLELSKEIELKGKTLKFKNGILKINNEDYSSYLSDDSIIMPLFLIAGKQDFEIKIPESTIKIKYREVF
ncbi:MAG: phage tail protein [Treponema sp.]|nr:MAG: phage tail protein [Treponema sp.]